MLCGLAHNLDAFCYGDNRLWVACEPIKIHILNELQSIIHVLGYVFYILPEVPAGHT